MYLYRGGCKCGKCLGVKRSDCCWELQVTAVARHEGEGRGGGGHRPCRGDYVGIVNTESIYYHSHAPSTDTYSMPIV